MNTEPTAVAQLQADMSLNPASPEAMEVQRGYRIGMDEQEPFRPDCFPSHEELEELGLPDIVKERIKLQRSLLEEKHRMYMFEKNYLQSAALYCHGNILAGVLTGHCLVHYNLTAHPPVERAEAAEQVQCW